MDSRSKLMIGIMSVVLGIAVLLPGIGNMWGDLVVLIRGMIPVVLILFGALMIWVQAEEIKESREKSHKKKSK